MTKESLPHSVKADWDDAPHHVRKKRRKLPIGVSAILAVALVAGVFYMADRNGWGNYLERQFRPSNASFQPSTSAASPTVSPRQSPPEDTFWSDIEQSKQVELDRSASRQTVFNDTNYSPRTDINTIQSPPRRSAQTSDRISTSRQSGLNGARPVILRWEDTRRKQYTWRGEYRWRESQIIYDDLCTRPPLHRKGSIEYRACRKAAKTYLRDQCRAGWEKSQAVRRMHCHAENAFRH